MTRTRSAFCALICSLLVACGAPTPPEPPQLVLEPATFDQLDGWETSYRPGAAEAFKRTCDHFARKPPEAELKFFAGQVRDWLPACRALNKDILAKDNVTQAEWDRFIRTYFTPYQVTNHGFEKGLFTGYFELELHGSTQPSERFRHAIYRVPEPMNKPFYSRGEIDRGALEGKGLELAYVDDPVRLFFLHIQGSGRVRLEDGSVMRVGYAAQNGHDYHSIGKLLLEHDVMEKDEMSAPALKDWLYRHDCHMRRVFDHNPSYIFFRELEGEDQGPIGAMGLPLVAEHSLAVDDAFMPYGVPVWLETTLPHETPYQRFMMTQDTGGAIKGPVRGDIFFGAGEWAEQVAGHMQNQGSYYVLLPRVIAEL